MKFTHLHVHSHYSLLDGLPKIDDLINAAKKNGMDSLALTDHGVMYGVIEFYKKAKAAGIKPIIGEEVYVSPFGYLSKTRPEDKIRRHLTLLAKDYEGYQNLLTLTTKAQLEGFYYKPRIDKELLAQYAKGLIGLSGCLNGEIAKTILQHRMDEALKIAQEYKDIFGEGNFYLELQRHPGLPDQESVNNGLREISKKADIPMVATADLHYLHKDDQHAQEILVAINTNKEITDDNRLSMKECNLSFRSGQEMIDLFEDVPEAIENTQRIAQACNLEIPLGELKFPEFPLEKGYDPDIYLAKLCWEGVARRYEKKTPEVTQRLEYELSVIKKTHFASYFLIVWDLVNWAKTNGIVVGPGRGSAAGSLIAYLLNITNLDPIKYNLLFERFLNPERISPPDIDMDFTDTRRDEVIAYAKRRYGHDHVAQIITFGTLASRAGIRDVGRSMGVPYAFCDRLAKMIPFNMSLEESLEEVSEFRNLYDTDPKAKELIDLAMKLEGVARHASTHACGVVIAPYPLTQYTPLQYASADDKSIVTQYEMHAVEDLGLLKMDFLGLKNLTIIEGALTAIRERKGIAIDLDNIPEQDEKTFKLLQEAHTTGVFQLESEGMKRYLKELKPTSMEDIIAMCALYRPGPMELIPSYIKRKHGKEKVTYLHPKLEPILGPTYAIGVYQEQMMRIARDLAGFTLPEADTLRKAIGKKIASLLDEQRDKLINGMLNNGIDKKTAQEIWELFPPFARYGFNRSHAACYALIAYQTAYLKAHYPVEFVSALLNSRQGDVERLAFFIEETRSMGMKVLPPDVNESDMNFTPVADDAIRFGLKAIKHLGEPVVRAIIEERQTRGHFMSMADFIERVNERTLNKKAMEALIKSGSFDTLEERNVLLENLDLLLKLGQETRMPLRSRQHSLLGGQMKPTLQLMEATPARLSQRLIWEKELLGLYISGNPLEKYRKLFDEKLLSSSAIDERLTGKEILIGGSIESMKKIITKKGDPMLFIKVKDFVGTMEITLFPRLVAEYGTNLKEGSIAIIQGKVDMRQGAISIICNKIKILQ